MLVMGLKKVLNIFTNEIQEKIESIFLKAGWDCFLYHYEGETALYVGLKEKI